MSIYYTLIYYKKESSDGQYLSVAINLLQVGTFLETGQGTAKSRGFFQLKSIVKSAYCQFGVFLPYHAGNLDFGRGDHFDVDALFCKSRKHLRSNS